MEATSTFKITLPAEGPIDEHCLLCGKALSDRQVLTGEWVHLHDNVLVHVDAEVPEASDQGWWPIGADCAKKVPAEFRTKGV